MLVSFNTEDRNSSICTRIIHRATRLIIELIIACMHLLYAFACGNMMTLNVLWMTLRKLISLHRLEQLLTACKIAAQKVHAEEFPQKGQREPRHFIFSPKRNARTVIWANKTEKCTGPWARLLLRNFLDLLQTVPYSRRCFYYSTSVWEADE